MATAIYVGTMMAYVLGGLASVVTVGLPLWWLVLTAGSIVVVGIVHIIVLPFELLLRKLLKRPRRRPVYVTLDELLDGGSRWQMAL